MYIILNKCSCTKKNPSWLSTDCWSLFNMISFKKLMKLKTQREAANERRKCSLRRTLPCKASCCCYYFLVIFKQVIILVFWQDKYVDILLNIFFIPSGSTFTVSPTTTAGTFISLFNLNWNVALKIVLYFYFRVVGIDSRGEDKDSTNCVICLTGDNLSQAEMEMDNLLLFPISHICLETTQSPLVISWWLPRKLPNVCLQSHIHWLANDEDDWQIFNNKDDGNN